MAANSSYQVRSSGDPSTDAWRLFYQTADGKPISPFHDIPLHAGNGHFHMVVEIPRGVNAKLEINKTEVMNPIKQDIKRGALRFVHDVHPHRGYIWNYGAFPQTWEDPTHKDAGTEAYGDNDPLDVCEIGSQVATIGQVKVVKVLGVLALIDEGETDWKVLTIDVNDPLAAKLNDIEDVERHLPGLTMASYEWFRTYKIPTGAPPNAFALEGKAMNAAFALKVIEENHQFWRRLHTGETPASGIKLGNNEKYEVCLANSTLTGDLGAHRLAETPALPDLGDHGLPQSKYTGSALGPDGTVKSEVERLQQLLPHATAGLSAILDEVAAAIAQGSFAKLAESAHIKSLAVAGQPTVAVGKGHDLWPYSVAISSQNISSAPLSFGIYQASSPHPLPHVKNSVSDHPDFVELVAGGFLSTGGHLLINTGAGTLVFAQQGGNFVAVDSSVADHSHGFDSNSACALASQAPLSLFSSAL